MQGAWCPPYPLARSQGTRAELNWKIKDKGRGAVCACGLLGGLLGSRDALPTCLPRTGLSALGGCGGIPCTQGLTPVSWSSCKTLQDTFAIRECDKPSLAHLFHPSPDVILPCQTIPQQGQEVLTQLLSRAHIIAWKIWGAFVLSIHQAGIPAQGEPWERRDGD